MRVHVDALTSASASTYAIKPRVLMLVTDFTSTLPKPSAVENAATGSAGLIGATFRASSGRGTGNRSRGYFCGDHRVSSNPSRGCFCGGAEHTPKVVNA